MNKALVLFIAKLLGVSFVIVSGVTLLVKNHYIKKRLVYTEVLLALKDFDIEMNKARYLRTKQMLNSIIEEREKELEKELRKA